MSTKEHVSRIVRGNRSPSDSIFFPLRPGQAPSDGLLSDYQAGNTPIPAVGNFYRQALRIFMATHPVHLAGPAGEGGSYLHDE
jgi:hypothetical protein